MRINTSIVSLFLIGVCLFVAYNFYKNSRSEYELHQVVKAFDKLTDDETYYSTKQRLKGLNYLQKDIGRIKTTHATEQRQTRLSSLIHGQLSELAIWNKQRRSYSNQALNAIRQNLQANPYDSINWMLALDLQQSYNPESQDRDWMLANLQKVGAWSDNVRLYSGFYCLLYWNSFETGLKEQCRDTVIYLSRNKQLLGKTNFSIREMPQAKRVMEAILNAN